TSLFFNNFAVSLSLPSPLSFSTPYPLDVFLLNRLVTKTRILLCVSKPISPMNTYETTKLTINMSKSVAKMLVAA
ncbi:hypothetical protein AB4618_26680, partial [Vibrio sp. 10N.222.48.A8]|uniref:hypothetical protein n=1 Tax=Vibrio sp. 10N.222.48.A8 TaxID=3229606 RepID=UPI00354B1B1E